MDDEPMWAADRVVALTPGSAITIPKTANKFAIKGKHLTLVKGNQFDGRIKTDLHKHIYEFLEICDMFKYRDTKNEAVHLMLFPLSLTGEEKIWLDELNEGTIKTWDKPQTTFISRFFPPTLFNRLLGEIRAFSQHENETLTEAWLHIKEILINCHGRNLSKDLLTNNLVDLLDIFLVTLNLTQKSGKSCDPPTNPDDQPKYSKTPINFDSEDEDEEPTPQPKPKDPKPVKENPTPKPYKPKIPYPQRLRKEKIEAQYEKLLDLIRAV
ncbi:reverse transcriptase domain-containing protein [Tanacetum coccineum]